MIESWRTKFSVRNSIFRGVVGELFGTFLLVFIGDCIVAQTVLSGKVTEHPTNAWINVNLGWGMAIVFCVMIVGKTSGGHINPAVSLMFYTFGQINALTLALYCVAQTVGAFLGAVAVYLFYNDAISAYHNKLWGNPRQYLGAGVATGTGWEDRLNDVDKLKLLHLTAGMFCSFPQQYLSMTGAFVDQVVGTGILCMFAACVIDKRNEIPAHLHSLLFGFVLMMIGCAFGMQTGYPINPARDFGPRLFSAILYGSDVFSHPHWFYPIATIVGPLVGGVLGGWLYYFGSGFHIPNSYALSQFEVKSGVVNGNEKGSEESNVLLVKTTKSVNDTA